jgi:hypothetical protein
MRRSLSVAMVAVLLAGTGVALASLKPLPLRDRLIQQGEFAGFRPEAKTQSFSTAKAWVGGGPHTTVALSGPPGRPLVDPGRGERRSA